MSDITINYEDPSIISIEYSESEDIVIDYQNGVPIDGVANTFTNVGSSGEGIYKETVANDVKLKKISAGSNKITITGNAGASTIDIDIEESNIDPENLSTNPLDRANHTGTQVAATISDFSAGVGTSIHGASAKATPVDADTMPLIDSAASNALKKVTWANIKATLKTYFDTLYATIVHTHAASDITDFDTEVSNNTDVAANTAARHSAATVSDTNTIDFALTGQQISGSVRYQDTATIDLSDDASGLKADVIDDSITNAKLAEVATATFKGRNTAGTGNPEDLTTAQATALLDEFVGDSGSGGGKGLVPAPASGDASKYLKGDGTWDTPAGGGGGSGIAWNEVTGTSQSASVDNGYVANNAALVTITLPTTAAVGKVVRVVGLGAGGWKVAQNASEIIHFGNVNTTTGTGGYLASDHRYDAVELVCVVANTEWVVASSFGNIDYV